MPKCLISALVVLAFWWIPLKAQLDLPLALKEAIELPGNGAANLKLADINGDNCLDYIYNDADSVRAINGLDFSTLLSIEVPSGFKVLECGNLNNDSYSDIAIAGVNPADPDSGYVYFYLGAALDSLIIFDFQLSSGFAELPSRIYFSNINGDNLIFIGTRCREGDNFERMIFGQLYAYNYTEGDFALHYQALLDGEVKEIQQYIYNLLQYMLIQADGEHLWGDQQGPWEDYDWADLHVLDPELYLSQVWHAGPMGGYSHGAIGSLYSAALSSGDNDQIYFYSIDSDGMGSSIVCMNSPDSSIAWQKPANYDGYHIVLTNILHNDVRDLFIFNSYFHVRDPYDGYLYEIGQILGVRGTYQFCADQENDGVDEFYYLYGDSVYIYNLEPQTSVEDNDIKSPEPISLLTNYPNPFNSQTSIRFNLKIDSRVKIEIYDILGRRINTIVDSYLHAGYYNIDWRPPDLASGIYYCRILSEGGQLTNKMMLLK